MKKNNEKYSSPNQLKDKIAHLKKELTKNQKVLKKITEEETPSSEENKKYEEENHKEKIHSLNSLEVIEDLEKEIDLLLKDNARIREEKLIVLANGENLKRRIYKEEEDIKKYRSFTLAEKLLPVLDTFERALQIDNVSPEIKNFLMGFEIIHKLIKQAFSEENISEIETSAGYEFDSKIHHAIEVVENNDIESGKIVKVLQKGYKIHDRVLRHISVTIAK